MAVIGQPFIDLVDIMKQTGPDGRVTATIIEMLAELSPVYSTAHFGECNDGTAHEHSIRSGLPTVTWGRLYKGMTQSKSNYTQVRDTTGFLEALCTVDSRAVKKYAKDKWPTIRMNEANGFIEAMMQEFETGVFYHDTATTPDKFKGMSARYDTITNSGSGKQIVDGGGTGSDNTSIWFVTWGDRFTSLLYPEGTQAGVVREDKGEQRVLDEDGNPYFAMEETFGLDVGLTVGDWRYNSRVANLDVSQLADGNVDVYPLLSKAYYKLKNRQIPAGQGRLVCYMNKEVLERLDNEAINVGGGDNYVRLKTTEVEGREIKSYRGIPIYETEQILTTEGRVLAA